jgi:hypothetical protein
MSKNFTSETGYAIHPIAHPFNLTTQDAGLRLIISAKPSNAEPNSHTVAGLARYFSNLSLAPAMYMGRR